MIPNKKTIEELSHKIFDEKFDNLNKKQKHVLEHFFHRKSISRNVNELFYSKLTFGQKLADKITTIGGSWKFIILFGLFLFFWILFNSYLLKNNSLDPFPYILLNLLLSMLAAIQAPVIMMSQNRQSEKDRIDASLDYEINLKAELEIQELQEKLDELLKNCQLQTEQLEKFLKTTKEKHK